MPIASGASGRVDVGVDSSIAWSPDGSQRKDKLSYRNCDSYLQRYQELKERQSKQKLLQLRKNFTDPRDDQNKGPKDETRRQNGDMTDGAQQTPSEEKSKKSSVCVIL